MSSSYGIATNILTVPSACQMISVSGPTAVGSNQITEIVSPSQNTKGMVILSFYTQVIQAGMTGNLAQSLLVAAASAPTDFSSKANCFPIYRTFQSDKQSPIALGGFAPMNIMAIKIPSGWGIWQVLNVVNSALDRNNIRFGIDFL